MRHAIGLARTATRATAICAIFLGLASASSAASAAQITFNDVVTGATSYAFDGDGDGIKDVTFSTTDPGGFRTIGPGLNQSYILEPGLEGTSLLPVDLRVDFAKGPTGTLTFAFALNSSVAAPAYAATFQVFDASQRQAIDRIMLTCSGGPFRERTLDHQPFKGTVQRVIHLAWL